MSPQQAERAANNFFRKGNLMALRELALRRTADRVEGDVQAYRVDQSIESVWKTGDRAADLRRPRRRRGTGGARRGAAGQPIECRLACDLCRDARRCSGCRRARARAILGILNLAQELGATTAVIASPRCGGKRRRLCAQPQLSKLVIGRDPARRLWPWQRSSGQKLALLAPDIDLVEIGRSDPCGHSASAQGPRPRRRCHHCGGIRAAPSQAPAVCVGGLACAR